MAKKEKTKYTAKELAVFEKLILKKEIMRKKS